MKSVTLAVLSILLISMACDSALEPGIDVISYSGPAIDSVAAKALGWQAYALPTPGVAGATDVVLLRMDPDDVTLDSLLFLSLSNEKLPVFLGHWLAPSSSRMRLVVGRIEIERWNPVSKGVISGSIWGRARLVNSGPVYSDHFWARITEAPAEKSQRHVIDVGATSVDVLSASQQNVSFDFKGGLAVPCFRFEEAVVERENGTVGVKVRARSTSEVCITKVAILHVAPLTIDVSGPGKYTFEFWRGTEVAPLVVKLDVP